MDKACSSKGMDNTYIYMYKVIPPPLHLLVSSPLCVYIYMIGQYWNKQQLSKSSGGSGNGIDSVLEDDTTCIISIASTALSIVLASPGGL